jgi:hypothetical protein
MKTRALLLAALLTAAAACGGDDGGNPQSSGTPSAPSTSATASPTLNADENGITVGATDDAYTVTGAPAQPGFTKITFENTGTDLHMAAIARLNDGKTADDAKAALLSDDEADDEDVFLSPNTYLDGNPSLLTPGAKTATHLELAAGKYVLMCLLQGRDGEPNFAKGMIAELPVSVGDAVMTEPTSTGEIVTDDETLTLPDLSSGKGVYTYTNDGEDDHGLLFVKLHDGATYDSFIAWSDKYFAGEAKIEDRPGDLWGGILASASGEAVWVTLDLPPGNYLALDTETTEEDNGDTKRFEYYRDENGGLRAEFSVTG